MRRLQIQFFVSYAVFGCIGPLLPVYLKEVKGFTEFQIGINQALTSIATILSPILITLLADLRIDPRRILGCSFLISSSAFFMISTTTGVVPALLFYTLHSLAFMPTIALQDGYYFSLANRAGRRDIKPYHRIRVWGTIGFIVPSLALFFLLERNPNLTMVLWCAMTCCALSALHAQRLPQLKSQSETHGAIEVKGRLPSTEAFAALFGPKGRWFLLGLFFAFSASTAYHTFFPVYLRTLVHMKSSTIGIVISTGVFLEIFYILGLGRLRKRFGMRALMVAGLCSMVLRLTLLATFPSVITALATQVLHGLEICAVYVLPVMFLNQLATDRFRNSIQGVYTMLVVGGSRIAGGLIAGRIAQIDLQLLFYCAAGLALTAVSILLANFRPEDNHGDGQGPLERQPDRG